MKEYTGNLSGKELKIGIVVARFNELITNSLLSSACSTLVRQGVSKDNIEVAWVPGAFEIPLIAQHMAKTKKYDAIICLGAVIKGATPHFDYVSGQTAAGIAKASLESGVPVIFGVLTTNTLDEALERAGTKAGNKGFDAALAAIEMANLIQSMPSS